MAKIEGTQSIPAEWLDEYRGNLTEVMPNGIIRSRYPYRIPLLQDGGYKVTQKQQNQRTRWKTVRDKFKDIPLAVRQRWYAARPPWASLLWYYNYFMMSGLMGNAVVGDKGGGVIKDIHHYEFTMTAGATPLATIAIDTCDPTKSVPFFFGAGWYEILTNFAIVVYPYLKSLNSTQMVVAASAQIDANARMGVTLIEYI